MTHVPERDVLKARLDILVRNLMPAQLASLAIAGVLLFFFRDAVPLEHLLAWTAAMLLVAIYRLGFWRHYRRQITSDASLERVRRCWRMNYAGVVLIGAVWGSAAMLFFSSESLSHQVLLVCAIAGITAGAVASMGASRAAVSTFMLLVLLPLSVEYLALPGAVRGLGVMLIVYLGLMLVLAKVVNGYIMSNLGLENANSRLNRELTDRMALLENAKRRVSAETDMARAVFEALMPSERLTASNIISQVSSRSDQVADLLLIETREDGKQTLMLGHFSERGLAASLGAIPVADIFTSMSRKGFAVDRIALEINRKLFQHLPNTLQLSACFVEIDPIQGQASVWNGGMEAVYLLNGSDGTVQQQVMSRHPPLGSCAPDQFESAVQILQVMESDQLFMASNGVLTLADARGEAFGRQRLETILNDTRDIESIQPTLMAALEDHSGGRGLSADITYVTLRTEMAKLVTGMSASHDSTDLYMPALDAEVMSEPEWGLKLSLRPEAMRKINPVPVINHIIGEFNGSLKGLTSLELTIGELYKNALDHGVMGLSSAMKSTPEGFAAYYETRERQLARLKDGVVEIEICGQRSKQGGEIGFTITDSGEGFDHRNLEGMSGEGTAHGRGVALAKSLCEELVYNDKGNQVRGRYRWSDEDS